MLAKIDSLLDELKEDEKNWDDEERYARMKTRIEVNQRKREKKAERLAKKQTTPT